MAFSTGSRCGLYARERGEPLVAKATETVQLARESGYDRDSAISGLQLASGPPGDQLA